jgi:hypothetical protein
MSATRSLRAVDQIVNSASSALFSLGIVATTDDATLGAIAIAMTPVALLLGLARTSIYEGILLRPGGGDRREFAWLPAVTGLVCGAVALVTTMAIGTVLNLDAAVVAAIAVVSAAVLLFDGLRFAAFTDGRAMYALIADVAWLAIAGGGVAASWIVGTVGLTELSWWYGGSALVACLAYAPLVASLTRSPIPADLRAQFRFGSDFVLQVAPGQSALLIASLVSSLAAVGELRAAVTLYNPLATIVYAIRLIIIDRSGTASPGRIGALYATASVVYAIALTASFELAPGITAQPFGALPALVLALVGVGEVARHVTQASIDSIRVTGALRRAIALRSTQAVLLVVLSGALGLALDGTGLALARALAFGIPVAVIVMTARRSVSVAR